MKALSLLLATCILLAACASADDADGGTSFTAAEREWCAITDASENSALKFDVVFEAGINLGLDMDLLNAQAAASNEEHHAAGMSDDEAARAVSDELLEMADYRAACQDAFRFCAQHADPTIADAICPPGSD